MVLKFDVYDLFFLVQVEKNINSLKNSMTDKKEEFKLSVDSNIMEVVQRYPGAAEIFMKAGLPCVGCAAAHYEKISDVVAEFGIDGEKLVKEIEESQKRDKK